MNVNKSLKELILITNLSDGGADGLFAFEGLPNLSVPHIKGAVVGAAVNHVYLFGEVQ
jgi:hypothetical protein